MICFKYFHCHKVDSEVNDDEDEQDWSRTRRHVGVNVETDMSTITGVLARMQQYKKSETPPPPYEPPPSYNIAMILGACNEACVISEPVLV